MLVQHWHCNTNPQSNKYAVMKSAKNKKILTMIALLAVQSSEQTFIHVAILFMDT